MATLKIKDSNGNWQEVFALKGNTGPKGEDGKTPDITLEVTTLPAGSTATVTKSGTSENPIFRLGIPKGDKGDTPTGVVKSVNNESPDVNGNVSVDVGVTSFNGQKGAVSYSAPVSSVDGKTGAVDLSGTYQPKGNYLTSAPVTSVMGKTGAVTGLVTSVNGTSADASGNVAITNLGLPLKVGTKVNIASTTKWTVPSCGIAYIVKASNYCNGFYLNNTLITNFVAGGTTDNYTFYPVIVNKGDTVATVSGGSNSSYKVAGIFYPLTTA